MFLTGSLADISLERSVPIIGCAQIIPTDAGIDSKPNKRDR